MCRLLEKWSAACVSELRTKQQTSQDTSAAFRFRDDGASVGWAPSTSWLPEHIWSQLSAFPAGNGLLRCPLVAGLGWWNLVTCGVLPRTDAEPKPPLLVMELCTTENHWQAVSNIQLHQPAKLKLNKVKQKTSTVELWGSRTLFCYFEMTQKCCNNKFVVFNLQLSCTQFKKSLLCLKSCTVSFISREVTWMPTKHRSFMTYISIR